MGARWDVPDVPDAFFGMTGSLSAALISGIIKIVWENQLHWLKEELFIANFAGKVLMFYLFLPALAERNKTVLSGMSINFF